MTTAIGAPTISEVATQIARRLPPPSAAAYPVVARALLQLVARGLLRDALRLAAAEGYQPDQILADEVRRVCADLDDIMRDLARQQEAGR